MPMSLLRMLEPRKYMSDADFKQTKMIPNEVKILEFLKANPSETFTGMELGEKVNGWKNHSMGKWARKLVRRGLVIKADGGYRSPAFLENPVSFFHPLSACMIPANFFPPRSTDFHYQNKPRTWLGETK